MGIFQTLKSAAAEANEEAHGVRLDREYKVTMVGIARMHDSVRPKALMGFLIIRQRLLVQMSNWSQEGRLKVASSLRDEARKKFDLNLAESYANWLASAWLETSARSSYRARAVHSKLEGLANELISDRAAVAEFTRRVGTAPSRAVREIDIDEAAREADHLFHVVAKMHFYSELFAKVAEGEVESAVVRRSSTWERRLLMGVLLGIWYGLVKREAEGDVDDKVVAASIAKWFAISAQEATAFIYDLTESRVRQEVRAICLETSRAVSQSGRYEVLKLTGVIETIRRLSDVG